MVQSFLYGHEISGMLPTRARSQRAEIAADLRRQHVDSVLLVAT